jgi:fatty-acyl-CoA synthase
MATRRTRTVLDCADGDALAVVMGETGQAISYGELDDRSDRLAQLLANRGLRVGDSLAILLENHPRYFEACWAAQRSALYYTPINCHLTAAEVDYVISDCDAKGLITSHALADVADELALDKVEARLMLDGETAGFEAYEREVDAASPLAGDAGAREGQLMLYSSGTTGKPKGIRRPLPDVTYGDPASPQEQTAQGMASSFGFDAGTVYLCPAPLYHSAPLVTSMSVHRLGGTVVVMEHFDPLRCLELIERYGVTHAQFVPTMFVRMLRLPREQRERFDLSSLRQAVHAAAPCPVQVKREMLDWWGPIIHEYYSGTEDLGSTWIGPGEWRKHPGSVGRPHESSKIHIVGSDGRELPVGEVGTVYFDSRAEVSYHKDAAKTAAMRNDVGWRTLGDVGYLDDDGYLYLTDRDVNIVISGGGNIYPQEAENVLLTHPAVADAAVIGVPDQEYGERVLAVVVPTDAGSDELADELARYCRQSLAAYKCPRTIEFTSDLPRDPNGKLYKRRLREQRRLATSEDR